VPARRAPVTLPATEGLPGDPWLDRWLPLIERHALDRPILELGCGGGRDSATLAGAGHRVVGIDLSAKGIAKARTLVPTGEFHCQDIRAPFPVADGNAGVVVASLSLHYFPWPETVALVARVREVLRPRGVLLCRLNSTGDHNFGASGHPEIAENYYNVDGEPKRFFDRAAVQKLFASGWRTLGLCEAVINRYDLPKSVWEIVLERKS
jgi:SAM-dependent methyltransferase